MPVRAGMHQEAVILHLIQHPPAFTADGVLEEKQGNKSKGSQRYEWKRANYSHGSVSAKAGTAAAAGALLAYRPLLLHRCQPCSSGSTSIYVAAGTPPTSQSMSCHQVFVSLGHCARTRQGQKQAGKRAL